MRHIIANVMKFKRIITLLIVLSLAVGMILPVSAVEVSGGSMDVWSFGSNNPEAPKISACEVDGTVYLILPSSADPTAVPLWFTASDGSSTLTVQGSLSQVSIASGDLLDLTALCGEQQEYRLTLTGESISLELTVCFSSQIAAMYLTSDDPVNQGREWVESSADKSNKATGTMFMQNEDGSVVYNGTLSQIKGRGNSTWKGAKKPYQIKLGKKTDLLETGDKANANKTWVLLANYFDPTMLRNTISYDLAAAMGMDAYMEQRFVDLYYDGEYRGTYLLCEKVDIDSGRVDVADLEGSNEDANPDVELEDLARGQGSTANGASYYYCYDMNNPDNISGGYLLELDFATRAMEEACYFITRRGYYVVVKNPEFCSKEEMDYIASAYQEIEDTIYSGGTNPTTGKSLAEYMDLKSVAECYLVNELSKNPDGFHTSAYLYKDADSDTMYMGPIWDYDLGYGIGTGPLYLYCQDPEGWFTSVGSLSRSLYQIQDFREAVYDVYFDTMYPLIQNVLLGDYDAVSEDGHLHSLSYYEALTQDSLTCNSCVWPLFSYTGSFNTGRTYEANLSFLENYLPARAEWLAENLPQWIEDPCPPMQTYIDVPNGRWFTDAINQVTEAGCMVGYGNGTFLPNGKLSRVEMTQILYNISGKPSSSTTPTFTDTNPASWYGKPLSWACENNIVCGYPDNTFKPNASITRQDVVTLLYRFSGSPKVTGNEAERFSDYSSISGYARDAMEWAVENEIVLGYTDNTIQPRNSITRAEVATLISKILKAE